MNGILILLVVILLSTQHVTKKIFNNKTLGKGSIAFSAIASLTAALFFIFQIKLPLNMNSAVVPYSILFALGYGSSVLCSVLAISCGSLSLTSLVISYSLIIPTLYGMIFLKESISSFLVLGLILLVISLFLINYVKGESKENKPSLKWLILVTISFVGNGLCSTVQKVQQLDFNGNYKSEFMSLSLIIVFVSLLIGTFITEKEAILPSIKIGILPIVICGLANGACNLLVMILSNTDMPASVMFPLLSAGSIILTYFISRFLYKERLTTMQNIGFLLGVASIVFLNL